ncbi:MAG TPA: protein tyrosine phosphatase family protein [Vicinamibacterales bacterium]
MRLSLLVLALLAAPVLLLPLAADPAPGGVSNYTRVDATFACAGATPAEAMPAIRSEGFRSVINLRLATEEGADIDAGRRAAEAVGLRYIHLPVDSNALSSELVDRFLAILREPDVSPVFIHCASANRVGMLWLVKRVAVDGWPEDQAIAEAERIGLRSPKLKAFALEYLKARAN